MLDHPKPGHPAPGHDAVVVPFTLSASPAHSPTPTHLPARPYRALPKTMNGSVRDARALTEPLAAALARYVSPHVLRRFLTCILHPDADPSLADGGIGEMLLTGLDWTDLGWGDVDRAAFDLIDGDPAILQNTDGVRPDGSRPDDPTSDASRVPQSAPAPVLEDSGSDPEPTEPEPTDHAPAALEFADPEDARRDAVGALVARALQLSQQIKAYGPEPLATGDPDVWLLADTFDGAVTALAEPAREGDRAAACVHDHLRPTLERLRADAEKCEGREASETHDETDADSDGGAEGPATDHAGAGRVSIAGSAARVPAIPPTPPQPNRDDDRGPSDPAPIRLQVLSDLHLDVHPGGRRYRPVVAPGIDAIIVAGDVCEDAVRAVRWLDGAYGSVGVPVVYVTGNHEPYGCVRETMLENAREAAAGTSVRVLENDELVLDVRRRRLRVFGATLWTDLAIDGPAERDWALRDGESLMNDYARIRTLGFMPDPHAVSEHRPVVDYRAASKLQATSDLDDPLGNPATSGNGDGYGERDDGRFDKVTPPRTLTPADTLRWHEASRAWLTERLRTDHEGPTLVVTHHAPHPDSLDPRFVGNRTDPFFASDLSDLIERHGPDVWVHGHVHKARDYRLGRTRIVCNPRGYPGERTGFVDPLVIEIPDQGASGTGTGDASDMGDAS